MDGLTITVVVASAYVLIGFGFSLASWLQAAELSVNDGTGVPSFFRAAAWFIMIWPLIAVYCYKAEIKRSIAKMDYDSLGKKQPPTGEEE